MKTNKFLNIMLMFVMVLSFTCVITSCGGDDDDSKTGDDNGNGTTIVDGIDVSLIPGIYEFGGNIAPSFTLYTNGTCEIRSNGLSGSVTTGNWTYEKTSHVLLVGTHVYTIKLLTEESMVAEWTSVNYGTSVTSWKRRGVQELKAVDLGLSVKWANMNVGATTPEEYGGYFAWGETSQNGRYTWSRYHWSKDLYGYASSMTKYCGSDDKITLEADDDAATTKLGKSWRMPTKAELDELRTKCTWTWTTQYDTKGYIVTSKTNGNSIFLPAAGYRSGNELNNNIADIGVGERGFYWSSSLASNKSLASNIIFNSSEVYMSSQTIDMERCKGLTVRAVWCP